jgi:hypothetical protein
VAALSGALTPDFLTCSINTAAALRNPTRSVAQPGLIKKKAAANSNIRSGNEAALRK